MEKNQNQPLSVNRLGAVCRAFFTWMLFVGCRSVSGMNDDTESTTSDDGALDTGTEPAITDDTSSDTAIETWIGDTGRETTDADNSTETGADTEICECPDDGNLCNGNEVCDLSTGVCAHVNPLICDDGLACNGVEICDETRGCLNGTAIICSGEGMCQDPDGYCACAKGYTGKGCDSCDAEGGYIEWPEGSGDCMEDPCAAVICEGHGTCRVAEDLSTSCVCGGVWRGEHCDQKWQIFLSSGVINDVAFDNSEDGWFATSRGLIYRQFNNTLEDTTDDSWQLFTTMDGLASNDLAAVTVDEKGDKWAASDAGIMHLNDGGTPLDKSDDDWKVISVPGSDSQNVRAIDVDALGRVWTGLQGNGKGVFVLDEQGIADPEDDLTMRFLEEEEIIDIAIEEDGGVWFVTQNSVFYFHPGTSLEDLSDDTWVNFTNADGLEAGWVTSVAIDRQGGKYFGYAGGQLKYLNDNDNPTDKTVHEWATLSLDDYDYPSDTWQSAILAIQQDNVKWFNDDFGSVRRLEQKGDPANEVQNIWTEYSSTACPLYFDVTADGASEIIVDSVGKKWVLSSNKLHFFDDSNTPTDVSDDTWVVIGQPAEGTAITSMAADPDGGFWFGTSVDLSYGSYINEVYYLDPRDPADISDDIWSRFTYDDGLSYSAGAIRALGVDPDGNNWFALIQSSRGGSYALNLLHDNETPLNKVDDVWVYRTSTEYFPYIVFDPNGGYWLRGEYFDDGGTPANQNDDEQLVVDSFYPSAGAVDRFGNKWFGYDNTDSRNENNDAAVRYLDDRGTPFDLSDDIWVGFSTDDGLCSNRVSLVLVDAVDDKWFACFDPDNPSTGLSRLNDNGTPTDKSDDRWDTFTRRDGLASNIINDIAVDDSGGLWIATPEGINYFYYDR